MTRRMNWADKDCASCGSTFSPNSGRQKWCTDCTGGTKRGRKNMRAYNITKAQFDAANDEADGHCPMCGKEEDPESQFGKLSCDHDHETMDFRGMLCRTCNMGMGLIDDPEWLARALEWQRRRITKEGKIKKRKAR